MIRQQIGDVLEISFEGHWYYLVVLSKIVMFGGNIVFAYHTDGRKMEFQQLKEIQDGFNICTDLLWPKRNNLVKRIGKFDTIEKFYKSKLAKGTNEHRKGIKADRWYIYDIKDLRRPITRVKALPNKY